MTEIINLQIPKDIYDYLLPFGLKNGYDLADYIEEDETEYLTRSEANKKSLYNAMECDKQNKNFIEISMVDL